MKRQPTLAQIKARKENFAKWRAVRAERRIRNSERGNARSRYEWLKAEVIKAAPKLADILK